jgi:hypothetical protein
MPSAYKVMETMSVDVKMLLMWISWSKTATNVGYYCVLLIKLFETMSKKKEPGVLSIAVVFFTSTLLHIWLIWLNALNLERICCVL